MILAIFAGIGSGKSSLLKILKNKGFTIIEADKLAHEIYKKEKSFQTKLIERFGKEIFDDNFNLNKKFLADKIFKNKEDKNFVEELIHPLVWEKIKIKILYAKKYKQNLAVESAIIPNENLDLYDYKIFIDIDDKLRFERLQNNRSYTKENIKHIIKNQPSKEKYKKISDFIIYNNFDFSYLEEKIEEILEKITNENVQSS